MGAIRGLYEGNKDFGDIARAILHNVKAPTYKLRDLGLTALSFISKEKIIETFTSQCCWPYYISNDL